jgi:hypothetical protein
VAFVRRFIKGALGCNNKPISNGGRERDRRISLEELLGGRACACWGLCLAVVLVRAPSDSVVWWWWAGGGVVLYREILQAKGRAVSCLLEIRLVKV